jgi:hypothetical protein
VWGRFSNGSGKDSDSSGFETGTHPHRISIRPWPISFNAKDAKGAKEANGWIVTDIHP